MNYEFWNEYHKYVLKRIGEMLESQKETYRVDLHIHSKYSSDGKDTIMDKIIRAQANGFDIISITDHDSYQAYMDIYDIVKNQEITMLPIIVTGIEHSLSCKEYPGLCHILQYFINIECMQTRNDVKKSQDAYWNRARNQFERMQQNAVLSGFAKQYKFSYQYKEYKEYLSEIDAALPDYRSLFQYIYSKFKLHNVKIADIYYAQMEENRKDSCETRRLLMKKNMARIVQKYDIHKENDQLLDMIFSPVGIDDQFFPEYPPIGSLSITDYGQILLESLKSHGMKVIAHPVDGYGVIFDKIKDIVGLEINQRNWRTPTTFIREQAQKRHLIVTIGSDSHSVQDHLYNEIDNYTVNKSDLMDFYRAGQQYLNNETTGSTP